MNQWRTLIYEIFISDEPIEKYFEHLSILIQLPLEKFRHALVVLNTTSLVILKSILSNHVIVKFDKFDKKIDKYNVFKTGKLIRDIYELSKMLFMEKFEMVETCEFNRLFHGSKTEFCPERIEKIKNNLMMLTRIGDTSEGFEKQMSAIGKQKFNNKI